MKDGQIDREGWSVPLKYTRARVGIGKLVKRPNKGILTDVSNCDPEYGDFVCRMLELQEYLDEQLGVYELPRKLDGFLLTAIK